MKIFWPPPPLNTGQTWTRSYPPLYASYWDGRKIFVTCVNYSEMHKSFIIFVVSWMMVFPSITFFIFTYSCQRIQSRHAFGSLFSEKDSIIREIAQCRMVIDQARLLVLKVVSKFSIHKKFLNLNISYMRL